MQNQLSILQNRLKLIAIALLIISSLLIIQLLSFQFRLDPEVASRLRNNSAGYGGREVEFRPNRGQIFDRDGEVFLAVNTLEYRIGISPGALGPEKREIAKELARVLDENELDIYQRLLPDENGQYPAYVTLKSPVSIAVGQQVDELDIPGIVIEPIPLRDYPQGDLTAQLIGFVNYDGRGFWGVEGHYNAELAGQSLIGVTSNIPLDVSEGVQLRHGQDLQLTIDRDVQFLAQQLLVETVQRENALGGHIIIMNPKTGEILAMASVPVVDIERYNELPPNERPLFNGTISYSYEPGSIFKILTAAVALDIQKPGLDLNWTYFDEGCEFKAGVQICTSTSTPTGTQTFGQCLVLSLNTCTVRWVEEIGISRWYDYLRKFGMGVPTGVDLEGEGAGIVNWPGSSTWSEANFLQTSFGQGISVTPLQFLVAANAIANDGLIMQPYIVMRRFDGDRVYEARPTPISRPISAASAQMVRAIMVDVVNGIYDNRALVENYQTAGKTGTAQKLEPNFTYSSTKAWASFIGFLPADDPQISVLIMLDEPTGYWGSQTAAPAFAELMDRLVVMLEIPPDTERIELVNAGGHPFDRD
jgi:cell division protein FtsI/penicillin-binding protein 2